MVEVLGELIRGCTYDRVGRITDEQNWVLLVLDRRFIFSWGYECYDLSFKTRELSPVLNPYHVTRARNSLNDASELATTPSVVSKGKDTMGHLA
jgi:hypothetical protein